MVGQFFKYFIIEGQPMNSKILFVIAVAVVTAVGLATVVIGHTAILTVSAQDNTTLTIIGNLTSANMTSGNMTAGEVITGGEGRNGSSAI